MSEHKRREHVLHWMEENGVQVNDQGELPEFMAKHVPGISKLSREEKSAVGAHAIMSMWKHYNSYFDNPPPAGYVGPRSHPEMHAEFGQTALNTHNHLMATEPEYRDLMKDSDVVRDDGVDDWDPRVAKFITKDYK